MRRSPASNYQRSQPTTGQSLGPPRKSARDVIPKDKGASDVPPLQGGRELLGDGYLGLRSALHPRLLHDGLSTLTLRAFDLPPF